MTHEQRQAALREMREQRAERLKQIQQSNDASNRRLHSPLANQQGFNLYKTERIK